MENEINDGAKRALVITFLGNLKEITSAGFQEPALKAQGPEESFYYLAPLPTWMHFCQRVLYNPRMGETTSNTTPFLGRLKNDSVADCIGATPLVRINRLAKKLGIKAQVYAKLE